MAESNIDTAAMTSQMISGTQQLIQWLYEEAAKDRLPDQEKELLKKFVNGKGEIKGSNVPAHHAEAIKKALIEQNIPFMEVPGQKEGSLFLVRQEKEADLLAIEEAVSMTDTALTKELSGASAIANLKQQNVKNLTTLTFQDEQMAEIAKEKLYQSGQTFITVKEGKETKLAILPNALYKKNGKDLEYFRLNYALTQARGSSLFAQEGKNSPLIEVRKQQAAYDKNMIYEFCRDAKQGKHRILGTLLGNSDTYIEAKNGVITVVDRLHNTKKPISYQKSDSPETIAATLSWHTEQIRDMMNFDGGYYQKELLDHRVKRTELKQEYQDKWTRPQLTTENIKYHMLFNTQAERLMEEINEEATKRTKTKFSSPTFPKNEKEQLQFLQSKHQFACELLKDTDFAPVREFLDSTQYGIERSERQEILKEIEKSYEGSPTDAQYQVEIETESIKTIENEYHEQHTNLQEEIEKEAFYETKESH